MRALLIITQIIILLSSTKAQSLYKQIGANFVTLDEDRDHSSSVDISNDGNFIAIGSPHAGTSEQGEVKVYNSVLESDGSVSFQQVGDIITGKIEGAHVGLSVALSEDAKVLVIGDLLDDIDQKGRVSIYTLSDSIWKLIGEFEGQNARDFFGFKVDISTDGKTVLASGFNFVQIYQCTENECISSSDMISFPNMSIQDARLGNEGKTFVVGAFDTDQEAPDGEIFVYTFQNDVWVRSQVSFAGNARDRAGFSVAVIEEGDNISVAYGSPRSNGIADNGGQVTVVKSDDAAQTFEEPNIINGERINGVLGLTLDISMNGDVLIATSLAENGASQYNVFERQMDTGSLELIETFQRERVDQGTVRALGSRLNASGRRFIISSPDVENSNNIARVFEDGRSMKPSVSPSPSISLSPSFFSKSSKSKGSKGKGKGTKGKGSKASKSKGSKGKGKGVKSFKSKQPYSSKGKGKYRNSNDYDE
ncbi:hypothetical protein CTEN210_05839 [Chaetoceros tenuissimus]|uniref:Uncharacterized protein n=1 Tax=Chaetoceros tenuissimus TaxID=426638 RepID=A0AAD3CP90_9STRA|nr:hypothetical protein CTEN210_05839 [Chaetoceros tenuissimus]